MPLQSNEARLSPPLGKGYHRGIGGFPQVMSMPMVRLHMAAPHDQLKVLPQHVPSQACATCEVCCRFPEADSPLRPYFSADEQQAALAHGLAPESFPAPTGGQVRLVPHPDGEGSVCPAFDTRSNLCRLYDHRPFDCQLYPMALMWDQTRETVVLGWDPKCPYLRDDASLDAYLASVVSALEAEPRLNMLAQNPGLVTPYQDDVVIRYRLPRVTERVLAAEETALGRPLTVGDRGRFDDAARATRVEGPLCPSAWAFANHYLWTDLLPQYVKILDDRVCVMATSPDGVFMPVPPLGPPPTCHTLARVFAHLRAHGASRDVARIEQVPRHWASQWAEWGYRVVPKEPDYLYRTEALAALRGDRFKSQRGACNRLLRDHVVSLERYDGSQADACAAVHERWRAHKREAGVPGWGALLLEDSVVFHRRLLREATALGLVGWVARVEGVIRGYTFGTALHSDVFCVIAEIADRGLVGLSEYLFRATARWAEEAGYPLINTMDAAGLPQLARSKQAYDPVALVPLCTVFEA